MTCAEHDEPDCPVCFPGNAAWTNDPEKCSEVLTPRVIKKAIRTIMTSAAVDAARRRVHGQDQG